ncbi:MAG: ATP-binding cassette domain-containing protein [Planctomycetaceae bacterium]|nr:ATP-binding cassette domain-containing protein [Planctomycetaceae bacterium]
MSADDLETLGTPQNGHEPALPPVKDSRPREVVIRLDNVSKGFGSGAKRIEPVKSLSLDVERGKTLVIIGPSGTGKSVTLRLMLGLLDPDHGEVYAFGKKLSAMSNQELGGMRRRMAMLFQGGALFDSMTVGENVAFPMRSMGERDEDKIMSIVSERLRQVGLPGTEDKMPSELSGGMKKRAALARSIATRPEVILYDEPTTGLDPIMSDAIADLILDTHESLKDTDVTSIVVTHDMHVAEKVADRIIMLYGGTIVGDGPPDLYRRLGQGSLPDHASEMDKMIRQFVRGEADGPIQTVA